MARVTAEEVAGIIKVDLISIPDITPFIDVANDLVTDLCSDSSYTDAKLKLIELWLSAHFYAIRDPRSDTEKAGSVSKKVQFAVDLNLAVTTYGQQAMLIDTAGNLARMNKVVGGDTGPKTVGVTWAGTESE